MTLAAPFCRLLQAPEEAFDPTTQYVRICSAGTLFIVAFNVIGSVFRGLGDSKMPLITVAIACVVNIFGDLLLVAVFHLGAAGAALATVFAQAISVVLSLLVIARRAVPFTVRKAPVRFDRPVAATSFTAICWPGSLPMTAPSSSRLRTISRPTPSTVC